MTLHYVFPIIKHIDDVLPHIDSYFKVIDKEGYTYISYNVMMPDVFPPINCGGDYQRNSIRRECRGLAFDSQTGQLVSRPFHKFFNLGEPSVGDVENPLKKNHIILEKLDGSMLRPLPNGRWATKMGVTDVALAAETFIADRWGKYQKFADCWMSQGITPIFEYVGPHNRIVLEYEENMYLLAMRWNTNGQYLSVEDTVKAAKTFGIPHVSADTRTIEQVKEDDSSEGIVIRYFDGHMLKVKSDWYVKAHRAKELLHSDRRFVEAIVNGSIDDAVASFLPEDKKRAEEKTEKFSKRFSLLLQVLEYQWLFARERFSEKKYYAIYTKDWTSGLDKVARHYVFARWDEKASDAEAFLLTRLENSVKSNAKFKETIKEMGVVL